jgi:hypothetical protein
MITLLVRDERRMGVLMSPRVFFDRIGDVMADCSSWRVAPGAWGSGAFITSVEDRLSSGQNVSVTSTELRAAAARGEEFYTLRLTCEAPSTEIGILDSTAWYVKGDASLISRVSRRFVHTQIA